MKIFPKKTIKPVESWNLHGVEWNIDGILMDVPFGNETWINMAGWEIPERSGAGISLENPISWVNILPKH